MKITKGEEFTPITIVLETKDEADWMWLRLNTWLCLNTNSSDVVENNVAWAEKAQELVDKSIDTGMFNALDAVHTVEADD